MLLDLESTLKVVFTIFFSFWASAIVILFIATGLLLKRAEKLRQKQHGSSGAHH
jgi:hypothetical protein